MADACRLRVRDGRPTCISNGLVTSRVKTNTAGFTNDRVRRHRRPEDGPREDVLH